MSASIADHLVAAYLGLTNQPFGIVYHMTSVAIGTSHELGPDPWTHIEMIFT